MDTEHVNALLQKIESAKVAVYGDFCLDAYWIMNPEGSELSVETGLQAEAAADQKYSLGGAANVIANLAALNPAEIRVIGVTGDDIFGRELKRQLESLTVNTDSLVIQSDNFDTYVYCKRYLDGEELTRIDFGVNNSRSSATDDLLLAAIESALNDCDALILNQQIANSIPNRPFIDRINELAAAHPEKAIILDTRHYAANFEGVSRKANEIEAGCMVGANLTPGDIVSSADAICYAAGLYNEYRKPVFVTRGALGTLVADSDGTHTVPGIQILKTLDTVGAGDTTLSALACSLAAGASPADAAQIAGFAAAVTVQKLYQTGTASPDEILAVAEDHDYIYQPELAADSEHAQFANNTDIEICCDPPSLDLGRIKHAVFDHDGTISALREGWEQVMEPMMISAIMGDCSDSRLREKATVRVRDYVEKSTGIQTILQMEALADIVREFGAVVPENILTAQGYKDTYDTELLKSIERRREKLASGQLDTADYAIKGSVEFLNELRERGITLYLASGTDRDDVIAEAKALGYADLFDGGIYGSVGDVSKYSKKMVIRDILTQNDLTGSELACFGDGPVEMRECRKVGGIAIGIASDEVRRHGLNPSKRTRLIRAGAHFIAPDFSQIDQLVSLIL